MNSRNFCRFASRNAPRVAFDRQFSSTTRVVLPRLVVRQVRRHSTEATLQQAHRALNEQNLAKAKSLFEQLVAEQNATVDMHYNLGVVEWLSKNPEGAVSRWKRALT